MAHIKLHPRVTRALVELVKGFEGLRRRSARLSGGGWTVGYGHSRTAREGVVIGPEDAEALLYFDLSAVAERVEAWTFTPLSQNQFEALTAFAFNIGLEHFRNSDVLALVNAGRSLEAAAALEAWTSAEIGGKTQIVDALVRRRAAEKAHFLTPPDGFRPSPTPVIRPQRSGASGGEGPLSEKAMGSTAPDDHDEVSRPKADQEVAAPQSAIAGVSASVHAFRAISTERSGQSSGVARQEGLPRTGAGPRQSAALKAVEYAGLSEAAQDAPFGHRPLPSAGDQAVAGQEANDPVTASGERPEPVPPPRVRSSAPRGIVVGMTAPSPEVVSLRRAAQSSVVDVKAAAVKRPFDFRSPATAAFGLVALVGAALFTVGSVSLMLGRAEVANLAIGLLGVVLMTMSGGYFLLRFWRFRDGADLG